jgi:hypothetical protein
VIAIITPLHPMMNQRRLLDTNQELSAGALTG